MTRDEYGRWAEQHAVAFAFRDRQDVQTLLSEDWYEVLGCYPVDALRLATRRLLASGHYPPFLRDHPRALLQQLHALQAEDARPPAGPDLGTCTTCDGTGRVIVPHPRAVRDGEWLPLCVGRGAAVHYTAAVLCPCPLGRWFAAHGCASQEWLEDYERLNPRWRFHLAHRTAEERAAAALSGPSPFADVVRRLAAWGLPEGV